MCQLQRRVVERVQVDKITESTEQQEDRNKSHIGRANP